MKDAETDADTDNTADPGPYRQIPGPRPPPPAVSLPPEGVDLRAYLRAIEAGLIREALLASGGVVAHAAARLGLRRTTLTDKLRRQGLEPSRGALRRPRGPL